MNRGAAGEPAAGLSRGRLLLAVGAGVALVGAGVYLHKRPVAAVAAAAGPGDGSAGAAADPAAALSGDAGPGTAQASEAKAPLGPVSLSDVRVLACQDKGPYKTPADQCDHLAPIEQALSHAIEQSSTCVPPSTSSSTIEYVADVSFSHQKLRILLPQSGRSVHDTKAVDGCRAAVRAAMGGVALGGIEHRHARYKISVFATYRGRG